MFLRLYAMQLSETRKKKRGTSTLPIPLPGAFAMPDTVEVTTLEPTPIQYVFYMIGYTTHVPPGYKDGNGLHGVHLRYLRS